jgi:hypothetical protein
MDAFGSFLSTSTAGSTTKSRVEGKGAVDDFRLASDFHLEGGKENRPKAIKIQLRPDPLAR